jgi:chorismate mutase
MQTLDELRNQIDKVDEALIVLLAKRFELTEQVGIVKQNLDAPAQDITREEKQFTKLEALAKSAQLDPRVVRPIWRTLIDQVIKRHQELRKENLHEQ